jgi:hypothetical protein
MKYFSMFSLQKVWYWKRHEIIKYTSMGVNSMIWNHWKNPIWVNWMIWNHWIKPHGINSMISWYWINLKQHFKKWMLLPYEWFRSIGGYHLGLWYMVITLNLLTQGPRVSKLTRDYHNPAWYFPILWNQS